MNSIRRIKQPSDNLLNSMVSKRPIFTTFFISNEKTKKLILISSVKSKTCKHFLTANQFSSFNKEVLTKRKFNLGNSQFVKCKKNST